ncbi:MAG: hypothetical protein KDD58_05515 [Bdellovibrionales bacterium]|nr:hypothetical protein [Bdellovibrionales bacterium]
MKVIKWFIFLISVFAFSISSLASSSSVNTGTNNNAGNGGATVNPGTNNNRGYAGGGTGGGANAAGNSNGSKAGLSTALNVATGAVAMYAFNASCATTPPGCQYMYLMMGLTSFAQAAQSSGAGGGSFNSAGLVDSCPECFNVPVVPGMKVDDGNGAGFGLNLPPNTPIDGPYKTAGELNAAIQKLKGDIDKSGYDLNLEKQTVTDPNGTETSLSSLNDMLSNGTGLSESEYADLKDKMKKISDKVNADYKVSSMGFDGGGGGGGSLGQFNFEGLDSNSMLDDYLKRLRQGRKPAAVAGMQRVVNGEAIGVAGDDIFKMVRRRYQSKRDANIFIEKLSPTPTHTRTRSFGR